MVVEMLTFDIPVADREAWLEADERIWTRFLERQAGFVRKEVWLGGDGQVQAVIWWESMAQWKAIAAETVAEVDEAMGHLRYEPTCRSFDVVG